MKNEESDLRVSIFQCDLVWENKTANLDKLELQLKQLSGKTDLLVLPEMFTTGFSMNCENLAETNTDKTITTLKEWSKRYNIALCGSFIAKDSDKYFNRAFFITQNESSFYDKRHLFRMGNEGKKYTSGDKLLIVEYKGFNICVQVCYDLRFPVWVRNVSNRYDLLIYVANWPQSRIKVWDILLQARAIENCSYVCGANRIKRDGYGLDYNGNSTIIDYKGNKLLSFESMFENDCVQTVTINKKELNLFRDKFPVWRDADLFSLELDS